MPFERTWIGTSLLTGFGATICCWGPALLSGLAGVSGVAGGFAWLHPLRPYLLGASVIGLSIAYYKVHRKRQKVEQGCSNCANESNKKERFDKGLLYGVTLLVALSFGYPYLSASSTPAGRQNIETSKKETMLTKTDTTEKETILKIGGMSCTGCSNRIHRVLTDTDGILESRVSYKKGRAVVAYDPDRIDPKTIVGKIEELGFKAETVE